MMRWMVGVLVFAGYIFLATPAAHAEPVLGLQPLQYAETLKKGERKKAFIDVTNPSLQPAAVQFTVQGFKQIDNKGTLSFYDDEKIKNGILLDHQEVEIPANKTLRLFFIVDSTKLPTGDVFAAIFAQTKPSQEAMMPSVRIGTLLILTNGNPGVRQASIEAFTTPLLQVGNSFQGEVKIKNTAPAHSASGFFPKITISMWPFGPTSSVTGPLVYAGNTRMIVLDQPSSQLGIYKITASFGSSHKDQWVVLITGVWRWVMLSVAIMGLFAGLGYFLSQRMRRSNRP